MKYTEIQGWDFIKLKWFVGKQKRIIYLKKHLQYLTNISPFDYSRPIKTQLIIRLKAIDAFMSSTFWLIHEVNDLQEKELLFQNLLNTIIKAKYDLIETPSQNWFDDSKLLKSNLIGNDTMSSFQDTVTVLTYLKNYKEEFELFLQNSNKIWIEVTS
jgi:hypothetical protein